MAETLQEALLEASEYQSDLSATDSLLIIDGDMRTVEIPPTEFILGVESDEKAESKWFRCPKFVGNNMNLYEADIRINYMNANGEKDQFIVTNKLEINSQEFVFEWVIGRNATKYKGAFFFVVCARKIEDTIVKQEWNTTLTNMIVLQGLEPDDETYAGMRDIIEQLSQRLTDETNSHTHDMEVRYGEIIRAIAEKGVQTLQSLPEDYLWVVDALENYIVFRGEQTEIEIPTIEGMNNYKDLVDARIRNKVTFYKTEQHLINDITAQEGMLARTAGENEIGDGEGHLYQFQKEQPASGKYVKTRNGLYAVPIPDTDKEIVDLEKNVSQLSESITEISDELNPTIALSKNNFEASNGVLFEEKTIPFNSFRSKTPNGILSFSKVKQMAGITKIVTKNKQLISLDGNEMLSADHGLRLSFSNNILTIDGVFNGQTRQYSNLNDTCILQANHTYTFSVKKIKGVLNRNITLYLTNSVDNYVFGVEYTPTSGKLTHTITPSSDVIISRMGFAEWYNNTSFDNVVFEFQVEESSIATDYVDAIENEYTAPFSYIEMYKDGFIELYSDGDNYNLELLTYSKIENVGNKIVVKQNGGDFTSLVQALKFVGNKSEPYIVELHEGTYQLSDEWTDEELSNANYPNGFYGTIVPQNTKLIGVGDRDKIIVQARSNSNYTWDSTWTHICTLNVHGGCIIENITVKSWGLRYTVHDDFSSSVDKTTEYNHCRIEKYNGADVHALGCGSHDGETLKIKDCIINPCVGWHGHNPAIKSTTLIIENTMMNGLELTDYLTGKTIPITIKNSTLNYLKYSKAVSSGLQYMDIYAVGCNYFPMLTNVNDFVYRNDGVVGRIAYTEIPKGKALKRNSVSGVEMMGVNDSIDKFFGISMETIPKSQYGVSDYIFCKVITKGYVSSALIDLSDLVVGDKIGIVNGIFSKVNDNAIGIVDYVINSIAYIRLY